MKKIFWIITLTGVLIFTGCGNNGNPASSGLTLDFFSSKIEGEITVSAYDSMIYKNYLEEAARLFEELYPGTKVNIETFSVMPEVRSGTQGNMQVMQMQMQDDPQGRADYISRVNTNLMSGSGADIYAMDVLPLQKFVESGALENLSSYMNIDPEFNKNDYRQNILDALVYRNGTWFLPVDFNFSYFAYDSTLIPADIASEFGTDKAWNTADLITMGTSLYTGSYKLFNQTDYTGVRGGMFSQLLYENIQSYVNLETGRANFTDGGFTGLLTSVKNYAQQGYIPAAVTGQQNVNRGMSMNMETAADRFFFKLNEAFSLFTQFTRNTGLMVGMRTTGTVAAIEADDEIAGIRANADGSVPFTYSQAFGINSQSKNKETAWAFLKFLLSKEMQLSTNISSMTFPLNNEARNEKAEFLFSGTFLSINISLTDQHRQAMENYIAAVEELSDNINSFVIQDSSLNDMISQDVRYFFDGSRTADEVARTLQNKADLYLSE